MSIRAFQVRGARIGPGESPEAAPGWAPRLLSRLAAARGASIKPEPPRMGMGEAEACQFVGEEFPDVCGACAPGGVDSPEQTRPTPRPTLRPTIRETPEPSREPMISRPARGSSCDFDGEANYGFVAPSTCDGVLSLPAYEWQNGCACAGC